MSKVACFEISGLRCWFWSDDHDPPHFHVKRDGKWEIRVKFTEAEDQMFEVVWGKEPKAKVLRLIAKHVKSNREALLKEWEEGAI